MSVVNFYLRLRNSCRIRINYALLISLIEFNTLLLKLVYIFKILILWIYFLQILMRPYSFTRVGNLGI